MFSIWDSTGFTVGDTAPLTPELGDMWNDTTDPLNVILKMFDGANWVPVNLGGGGGGGAALPPATRQGQVLVASPSLAWQPDDIDCGRF